MMRSRCKNVVSVLFVLGCLMSVAEVFAQVGTCGGVAGYPVSPADPNATVCPPYTNPIVFFSPHPDDETLGMGGAIRAAKTAGRTVIVELMTRGDKSGSCGEPISCGNFRVNEFTESMIRLGVDGVVGGKDGRNNLGDKELLLSDNQKHIDIGSNQAYCSYPNLSPNSGLTARVNFWLAHGGSGLSLRGTSGEDYLCHPDHLAVSLALRNANFPDTKYYQVYRIIDPARNNATTVNWRNEQITIVRETTNAYCGSPGNTDCTYDANRGSGKRAGLSAYNISCPSRGFVAFGWSQSTGLYFDGYDADCVAGAAAEYVDSGAPPLPGGGCGEANCVPSQGMYVSHFSGPHCTGTESYYLPYDGFGYNCRSWDGGGQCGTTQHTVTNYSARINGGSCQDLWPGGNPLSQFVTIYRGGAPSTFSLDVSLAGSGSGSVSSSPGGINCGGTCSASFTAGTVVTLFAAPASGSTFAGWSGGGCSGTGSCNVTMSSSQSVYATFNASGGGCGEPSCVSSQGMYVSHFSGPGCSGTESYYLPYDGYAYSCRTWDGSGQCGTIQHMVTNYSARINGGACQDLWPGGNPLSQFVTVYRGTPPPTNGCGEASCVPNQGMYVSHFSEPGCGGTESYYLPYDAFGYQCRSWDGSGQCGTVHHSVTNYSARINGGQCQDLWPSGNPLDDFVTIYR